MKLFFNGDLLTMEASTAGAEALLVGNDGRIAATGDLAALQAADAQRIDLQGRTLMPGFNDAHIHVSWLGLQLTKWVDARIHLAPDIPAIIDKYRQRAGATPAGEWVQGMGYNEALLPEGRHLSRHDLDQASREHPMYLVRTCGHVAVVNSRALALAGIDATTPDPPGGVIVRDERGQPTGVLQETAMTLASHLIPETSMAEMVQAIKTAGDALLSVGVTSATDPDVMPEWIAVYRQMDEAGELPLRLNLLASRRSGDRIVPLPEKHVSDTLRLDSVKFFADGGMTSATAAISTPYRETGGKGVLIYETEEMAELMWEAHRAGFRIGTHANGDVALEQVIGVYEALHQRQRRPELRHRIEHLALPTDDHLRRCARLGIMAATQTVFLPAMGATFRRYMPEQFYGRAYGMRRMIDMGLTVALSTDAPVVPDPNPWIGLKAAVDRLDHAGEPLGAKQAVSRREALWAYTMGGATLSGDGQNRGSLAPGKWADMIIVGRNPLRTPVSEWLSLRVEETYLGGERVFQA